MKKIAIILALLLAACSKPEAETIYNEIYINPEYDDELEIIGISKQLFDGKGGNAEFIVKSNLEYNLRADQDWVILVGSRASTLPHNKAVAFAVKPYEIGYADKNRTATITVEATDGSISRSFSIEQSPAETYHIALLSINPDPVTSLGGEVVVKIDSTLPYVSALEECDWLTLNTDNGAGEITLTAKKNLNLFDRSCKLTVTAEGLAPLVVTIKQTCFTSEHDNTIIVPVPDGGLKGEAE